LFLVLGINMAGEKEILWQWIAQTEGANFWGHFSPRCRSKGFFPRIQGRNGHAVVAALLGNALVVGRHHLCNGLFFRLRTIDRHLPIFFRSLDGLILSLEKSGQPPRQRVEDV
jgi:hypothetical protein